MFPTDTMVNATNIALDIGDQRMNPRQEPDSIFAGSDNYGLVVAFLVIEYAISNPAIRTTTFSSKAA